MFGRERKFQKSDILDCRRNCRFIRGGLSPCGDQYGLQFSQQDGGTCLTNITDYYNRLLNEGCEIYKGASNPQKQSSSSVGWVMNNRRGGVTEVLVDDGTTYLKTPR